MTAKRMRGMLIRSAAPTTKNKRRGNENPVKQQADAEQVVITIRNQNRCAQST